MEAAELFENAMARLQEHYGEFRFLAERDVVGKVEWLINQEIEDGGLPYRVVREYSVLPGTRADLVIFGSDGSAEVAVEFKYEPAPSRSTNRDGDIRPSKLPVADWKEIKEDFQRIQDYVDQGKVKTAYALLIDEGSYFHRKSAPPGGEWRDWGQGRRVLWVQAGWG